MLKKLLQSGNEKVRAWYASATAPADATFGEAETSVEKFGLAVVRGGLVLQSLFPLFIIGLIFSASAITGMAQTPGGTLFGTSDQTVGNGIRAFCRWFRVLIFFVGVIAFGVAAIQKVLKQPIGSALVGGIMCWGFAGLAQLFYTFSTGGDVEFNPDLGN